jgi:hypothetical protein
MFSTLVSLFDVLLIIVGGELLIRLGKYLAVRTSIGTVQLFLINYVSTLIAVGVVAALASLAGEAVGFNVMVVFIEASIVAIFLTLGVRRERKKFQELNSASV